MDLRKDERGGRLSLVLQSLRENGSRVVDISMQAWRRFLSVIRTSILANEPKIGSYFWKCPPFVSWTCSLALGNDWNLKSFEKTDPELVRSREL